MEGLKLNSAELKEPAIQTESNLSSENRVSSTHNQQDSKLTSNEIVLILLDACLNLSAICGIYMLTDNNVIGILGTKSFVLVLFLNKGLAGLSNPLVGYIADSMTGKFIVVVISTWCTVACNLLCILLITKNISYIVKRISNTFAIIALFYYRAAFGTKEALLYTQIPRNKDKLNYFIFLTFFWAYFIKMVIRLGALIGKFWNPFKYICISAGAISGFAAFTILLIQRKNLQQEKIEKGIIVLCTKTMFKLNKEDNYYTRLSEKLFRIFLVLVTTVGFFISTFLIEIVVSSECSFFEEEQTHTACNVTIIVKYILLTGMTAFVYYFFLSVFRKLKADEIDLRLQGIAYNFMGISMIILCLAMSSLRYMSTVTKGEAQLRLYNGVNETVIIQSSICNQCRLNPGKILEIMHLPCLHDCIFQIQIEFLRTKTFISVQLQAEEIQSYTYIVRKNALVKIGHRDPVVASNGMSKFFAFSNVDNLQGLLIFDDEYPVSLTKNLTDHVIINVPSTLTFKGFKYKLREKVYNHSTFELSSGTVYSVYIHVIGNTTTYETNVLQLNIIHRLNPFLLLLPTLVSQFAYVVGRLSLARFIMLESPEQTKAFLMSILEMCVNVGYLSWGITYSLTSIWIVVLLVFTCLHISFQFCYSTAYTSYIPWARKQNPLL